MSNSHEPVLCLRIFLDLNSEWDIFIANCIIVAFDLIYLNRYSIEMLVWTNILADLYITFYKSYLAYMYI